MTGANPALGGGVPFGRYLIRRRLARGGMGEVFLADQLGPLGPVRPVALKRMLPRVARDPTAAKMFLEEMALAAQLNHPNIATTYDFGEVDGVYFLAMEYVEGLTLRQIVETIGPLPVPEAITIAAAIAQALDYAHRRKTQAGGIEPVVHRDVSPHNVMLSSSGAVKLLDFGIARAELAMSGGRIDGKLAYAAPEQLWGAAPDRRADLWALGVVFYEILTGVAPFSAPDASAMLGLTLEGKYMPLEMQRPEAAEVASIVARALSPQVDDRWPTAESFRAACAQFGPVTAEAIADLVTRAGGPRTESSKSTGGGTGTGTGMSSQVAEPSDDPLMPRGRAPSAAIARVSVPAGASRDHAALESALDDRTLPVGSFRAPLATMTDERTAPAGVPRPTMVAPRSSGLVALVALMGVTAAIAGTSIWLRQSPRPETEVEAIAPPPAPTAPVETPKPVVVAPSPAASPAIEPSPAPPRPRPSRPPPSRPREAVKEVAPAGLGLLSVRTVPWSRLTLDGKELGTSPLLHHPTSAGEHTLALVPGEGTEKPRSITVHIRPGEVTKVFVDFPQATTRVEP